MYKCLTSGVALCALAIVSSGCANQEAPHTALSKAQSAVSTAEAKGAQDVPKASLYLKMAKDGVDKAESLMNDKDYDQAETVLERAQMDAQLATSLAVEEDAKRKANEQLERVKSLRQANARLAASVANG